MGRRIAGRPVLAPDELPPPGRSFVVSYVGSSDARAQIEAGLRAAGYCRGLDYIAAA